jgi:hypothetical protein
MTNHPPRTQKQNDCIHLWLRQVVETLNDAGFDMKKTLKPGIDIPWTEVAAKEFLWRPVQQALTNEESTTKIETIDPSVICDVITRHIGEKHGVVLPPFPSRFEHGN